MRSFKPILSSILFGLAAGTVGVTAQAQYQNDELYESTSTYDYFESDNWVYDDYGYYDEDFDWNTTDAWYEEWNDTDVDTWDNAETAHWGVYGYDDTGDSGLWDW